jgi:hypothetical protein
VSLSDAVKRAVAESAKPAKKEEVERPDPFEVAAEELASAKTSGERADVLRVIAELARLQK